jgi:Asp-tRNA(Asn)/Glu-tRNA(Gln) amidotransferase A subunit family amidase
VTISVRDSATLLDATAGPGAGDPYAAPAAGPFLREVGRTDRPLRIAWTAVAPTGARVDEESLRALADTVRLCAELGHRVEEADPVVEGAAIVPAFVTIAAANTVVNLAGHPAGKAPRPDEVETVTWAMGKLGETVTAADYVRATQTAHRLGRQMAAFHVDYDVLLTPALGTLPVKLGWIDMMMDDVHEYWRRVFTFSPFTVWFNLTGQPAMVLPLARSREGLPVAVQLVARAGDEAAIFSLASHLEVARPWMAERPTTRRHA